MNLNNRFPGISRLERVPILLSGHVFVDHNLFSSLANRSSWVVLVFAVSLVTRISENNLDSGVSIQSEGVSPANNSKRGLKKYVLMNSSMNHDVVVLIAH